MLKNAPLLVTLIIGAVLAIGASLGVREWEGERAREQFTHVADLHGAILKQRLSSTLEAVESIGALYAASEEVTRDEFRRFTEFELGERHAIQALEWIPRVKAADRAAFEAVAREDGLKGFTFTERNSQGRMVPAGVRDEYFPVYFVEPYRGNEAALGFDLGSNAARLAALERARDSGKLVATERITLVQETEKSFGFLVFQPVYRNGTKTDTVEDRRQNLQGFALGVLRIKDLARTPDSTAESLQPYVKMDVFVFDQSAPAGRQLLYPNNSPFETLAEVGSADCVIIPETIGGRDWVVVHCVANADASLVDHRQSLFVLILGLLVTGVTANYLRSLSNQRLRAANISADLAQLIDTANAPIFGVDKRGRINEWNQAAAHLTGYGKDEVLDCSLIDEFIPEEFKAQAREVLDDALEGRETESYEMPILTRTGETATVLLNSSSRRDVAGNIIGVIGIGQDITERKKGEAALIESEARYSDIVDSAQVLIQSVDPDDGRFVFTNRAWREVLGYSPDEVAALGITDVIHPDSMDHCMKVLGDVLDGRPVGNIQATFVSKDGRNVELEGSVICRRNEDGTRTTHSVFTDVTERKLAEAQVVQAAKLATLGEMATSVAHELNQPLNVIRMAAGNVLRKLEKGKADKTYLNDKLERIASQTERAAAIIDHMRMFGRKADEKPHELDSCDAIKGALDLMGEQLRLAEIEVVADLSGTCRPVLGHRVQMEQVILNLLTNAQDAIRGNPADGGSKITIAVDDDGADWVRITVSDNGGGIPETALDRIFDPFFTTKEMGKGTGLGLSVSFGIIRDMGGTIEAENADGGAKFTITLPAVGTDAEKRTSDAV